MLTIPEKIIFVLAALLSVALVLRAALRIVRIIGRGNGKPDWKLVPRRLLAVAVKTVALTPTWRKRLFTSLLHAMVVWAFMFYLFVNIGDVLEGLLPNFVFLGGGFLGNSYQFLADTLSVSALVGMSALLARRFVLRAPALRIRETTPVHPKARAGIRRDSLIVGLFIVLHVGGRFTGQTFKLALSGADAWQPFARAASAIWSGLSPSALVLGEHIGFWVAISLIMVFFPYFLYSKHIHIFMAPLNFLLRPERPSPGQLDKLNFEDTTVEKFGATRIEDFAWHQVLDAYACIMCNRCQDACPAYTTGKVLSPAALEINKRYFLNEEGARLERGEASTKTLLEFAISEEAVLACTACGACTDICPVGNDPMRDIMDIRRSMVLMENKAPEQWQVAFRGMERSLNPWNVPPTERLKWTEGLNVPTVEQNPDAEILWWVGCAPATDPRAQKTSRALVEILEAAGVSYAVLGQREQCTGDSARRAGNEYLFNELATANVEMLNAVAPKRVLTTCPHCMHTLEQEYSQFGGYYDVVHHTEFIDELIKAGRLKVKPGATTQMTYHDPCYLGRQNGVLIEPRSVLNAVDADVVEMVKNGRQSFCCGAGGAQMWKEEEPGTSRVSAERIRQAKEVGAQTLAVGCPFCMIMLTDAAKAEAPNMLVRDVVEIIVDNLVTK
ncbi:MAG TPA: heterodisulfide reductase-related iron-sulfur binding cluster [Anaerolineales bacterium]|nr:heterodisulfide reductase-related iron-sulfur binding cluster [Anaerolineales bacterium]